MSTIGVQTPDQLLNKNIPISTRSITLITGQNLTRGTLLGKILQAIGVATADGGNTGDGTVTLLVLAAGGPAIIGTYVLTCITAVTNGGIFDLVDPNGKIVATNITILAGAGGIIAFSGGGISFTITDGSTDFAADDFFTLTVVAGSLKYNKSLAAAVDGSEIPETILSEDKDATSADKVTLSYEKGGFNEGALTLGAGHTIASVREGLRDKGIFLADASPA